MACICRCHTVVTNSIRTMTPMVRLSSKTQITRERHRGIEHGEHRSTGRAGKHRRLIATYQDGVHRHVY